MARDLGDVDMAERRYVEVAVTWVVPLSEQGEGRVSLNQKTGAEGFCLQRG